LAGESLYLDVKTVFGVPPSRLDPILECRRVRHP
jgi:hypothetical protein